MKRSKFSEEQIVYAIRQADAGRPVNEILGPLAPYRSTAPTCTVRFVPEFRSKSRPDRVRRNIT
jgi:hypothetical protein